MKTHFTQDWKNWIATNVNAGQDLDGIFKILLDEGFSYNAIVTELNYQPSKPPTELINPFAANAAHQAEQIAANAVQEAQRLKVAHQHRQRIAAVNNNGKAIRKTKIVIPKAVPINSKEIDLRTVKNFLSPAECSKITALIKSRLRPSEISNAQVDSYYRNSRTCDLGRLNNEFIESIDLRICKLMGIHRAYSELLEGQYYQIGEEFKAHTDYFEKSEFANQCHEFGQRTYTVMIYLNDVEKGGETCFLNINKTFKPQAGMAVIWNNLKPDGSPNEQTEHLSNPVEAGYKAIITKWFRSNPASGYEHLKMFTKHVNRFD